MLAGAALALLLCAAPGQQPPTEASGPQAPPVSEKPAAAPPAPAGDPAALRLNGFFIASISYNSGLQIVPETFGGAAALADPGRVNIRFDKFGLGASRTFSPWLSVSAAVVAESHRQRHSHLIAESAGPSRFGCPAGRACERFGLEPTRVALELDRFSVATVIPAGNGLNLSLGRFDTPFGIERHDENLNLTASTSEVFRFGRPQRMTGLQAAYVFSPRFDATAWVVNRWEAEETEEGDFNDNNGGKSLGGRIGFAPLPRAKLLSVGLGGWLGAERATLGRRRSLLTADVTWSPNRRVVVAAEAVRGWERLANLRQVGSPVPEPAQDEMPTSWWGYSALVHYDVTRVLALSLRHALLDDPDRGRTGIAQRLRSLTIAPVLHLSAWIAGLRPLAATVPRTAHAYHWVDLKFEYRLNQSSRPVFGEALANVSLHDRAARRSHQLQIQLAVNF